MDRARAQKTVEAVFLAASGDHGPLDALIDEAYGELFNAGWRLGMAPVTAPEQVGINTPEVAASEPAAEPSAVPVEPPVAAPPEHRTMHVDVELEGGQVVGAHSVE